MKGFLRWDAMGNLGRDAELRTVGDSVVCSFSVGVNLSFKRRDGSLAERTEWINCSMWGGFAQTMHKYLTKGTPVFVSGEPKTREYTDRDNQPRTATDLQVEKLVLLPNPNRQGQDQGHPPRDEPRGDRRGYGAPQGRREQRGQQSNDYGDPPPMSFDGEGGDDIPF